jgi:hypothetical protein
MEFDKIRAQVRKTEPDIMRLDSEDYFEAVIVKARLGEVVRVLESIFGAPAWPSNNKMLKDTQKLVSGAGGLRKGQTLYVLTDAGSSAFAMLWPWQDGERITIKIARVK